MDDQLVRLPPDIAAWHWSVQVIRSFDKFLAGYFLFMTLLISAHDWIATVALAGCGIILGLGLINHFRRHLGVINPNAPRILRAFIITIGLVLICKPYQMPISVALIKTQDEGEGYVCNYYEVAYYAPHAFTTFVKVPKDNLVSGTILAYGWARYSPVDCFGGSRQNVVMVRNLPKEVIVMGSSRGRS